MNKKVAICYFGLPRHLKEIENTIEKTSNFDVFSHFWVEDEDLLLQKYLKERFSNTKILYLEQPQDTRYHAFSSITCSDDSSHLLKTSYNEKNLLFFETQLEKPGWCVNPKNITSMWNSMSKSVSLALSYASNNSFVYDRIVLLRTDIVFSEDFDVAKTFIGDVYKFLMPSYHPGSRIPLWLPDHIISMSTKAARAMTFLPQFSYHYYSAQRVPLIPEIMLGHHMSTQGMNISSSDLYYRREYKFYGDDGRI